MNPCSYGWNVSIWDFIRDAPISEEFRDITWRLLKELPEFPWVTPFVRGSDFLHFSVLLTLTPVASSSLFARGHRLVTQPRLAAFLNGCDLYLSLASLLYVSHNRLKKKKKKTTLAYAGLLNKKTPFTFCSMKETLIVPGLQNAERGRWWGGVVEGSRWRRFSPGPWLKDVGDGELEERGDSKHMQVAGL